MHRLAFCALPLAFACTGGPVEVPVTVFDAGVVDGRDAGPIRDGGIRDAGPIRDGGPRDGGRDAGPRDGSPQDADTRDTGMDDADGGAMDANVADGGSPDAAALDGGAPDAAAPDAGAPDAASPDAGSPPSGWSPTLIDDSFTEGEEIDLVDIDNDNDIDVVVSLRGTQTVRVHINGGNSTGGGNGTAWTPVNIAPVGSIVAVGQAIVDLNNDNRLDVVAVGLHQPGLPNMSASRVVWYEQPALVTDTWTEHVVLNTGLYGLRALTVGDLNGDGEPDLLIGAIPSADEMGVPSGDGIFWFRNLGNQTFAPPVAIDVTLAVVEMVRVADIDRDGVDDVVAVGRDTHYIAWFENGRTAGMIDNSPVMTRHDIANITEPNGFALGQFDADAALEVIVSHDDGFGGAIAMYDAPADPRNLWTRSLLDAALGGPTFQTRIAIADFNRDGMNDVVAASRVLEMMRVYTRQQNGSWITQTVTPQLTGLLYVDTGDIDGDLFFDLITVTQGLNPTRDELTWWRTQP